MVVFPPSREKCRIRWTLACFIYLFILIVAIPRHGNGQSASAAINGTVTDEGGAVIPGVRIALYNINTGGQRTTTTGAAGTYSIPDVAPGGYSIRALKDGFGTKEVTGIALQVDQTATLDFKMSVGPVKQTLEVVANLSPVDSTTSELGMVITTEVVNDLPLNGRNFTQLLPLTPGVSPISVAQNGGGNSWGGLPVGSFTFPSVNGQRNRSNMFLLDGSNDLAFLGNYNYAPIIDDVQELKLQSHNDLAEFGGVAGGIVNVVTKAGTNAFRGSAWEFLRNEQMDARNFFLPVRNPLRQNQFGLTIGGPLFLPRLSSKVTSETFFFFAYEGFRQSQAAQNIVQVPTAAELKGDFSSLLSQGIQLYNPFSTMPDPLHPGEFTRDPFPGNIIPPSLLSKAATVYTTLFPPAGPPIPGGNLYDTTKNLLTQDSYTGRIDRNFGSHDSLFGRISYFNEASRGSAGYPGALNQISIYGWNASVHEFHQFGPATFVDLHFGMPLIRVDLIEGRSPDEIKTLLDAIQRALVSVFKIPKRDRYQIVHEHRPSHFVVEDTSLGITRTDKCVVIQITTRPREREAKERFYKLLCRELEGACGIQASDVVVSMVTNSDEDWSFGHGRAQFLTGELAPERNIA